MNTIERFPSEEDKEQLQAEWDSDSGNPLGLERPATPKQPREPIEPDYEALVEELYY